MSTIAASAHESNPKVLIVEDEYLIASALRQLFEMQGAFIVGPAATVSAALELIAAAPQLDCAVLDVKLGDVFVFPVAEALRARGVRYAFMSGYDPSSLPSAYRDAKYFDKLEDPQALSSWVLGE